MSDGPIKLGYMGTPKVQEVVAREDLRSAYDQALRDAPFLARLEAAGRVAGWTDLEIRTFQVVRAVHSNQTLERRVKELEVAVNQMTEQSRAARPH